MHTTSIKILFQFYVIKTITLPFDNFDNLIVGYGQTKLRMKFQKLPPVYKNSNAQIMQISSLWNSSSAKQRNLETHKVAIITMIFQLWYL